MSEAGYVQYRRTRGRKKRRLYTLSAVITMAAVAVFVIGQQRQIDFLQMQLSALKQAHQQLVQERSVQATQATAQVLNNQALGLIDPDRYFDQIHPPNASPTAKLAAADSPTRR